MNYFIAHEHWYQAGAFYEISSRDAGAVEVDAAHDGDYVGLVDSNDVPIVFDLKSGLSLAIDVWCFGQDLDVILQRLRGYTNAGQEVWVDVGSEVVLTAASSDSVSDVAAAMATLVSDNVRSGTYRIAAQRAGDTDPGFLHFHGVGKA